MYPVFLWQLIVPSQPIPSTSHHISYMNPAVSQFLDALNHPFREEIDALRRVVLAADSRLTETVKWNAPNYALGAEDRFTMRIQPPKRQVQLIFHRGAAKLAQPAERLIADDSGLLDWKENDRAIATFRSMAEITAAEAAIGGMVRAWLAAAQ